MARQVLAKQVVETPKQVGLVAPALPSPTTVLRRLVQR
jgi:hypothetical protein